MFSVSRRFVAAATIVAVVAATLAWNVLAIADDSAPAERMAAAALRPGTGMASSASNSPAPAGHIEGGQTNGRWREGSRMVDQTGSFRHTGDRVTFVSSDGKLKFDCLENLCVERVARVISDSPDILQWCASGVITECAGSNYLLITQAILKAPSARQPRLP
jgi:hypothetical protein